MSVEYINDYGYIVETERAVYVFDYVDGRLPSVYFRSNKPLLFFVSNKHQSHFSDSVFNYGKTVIFSYDIPLAPYSKAFKMKSDDMIHLGFAKVLAIKNPKGGLCFVVKESDRQIFYGSDLNLYQVTGHSNSTPAYEKEIFFNTIQSIKKQGPFDIAILEVNDKLEEKYMEGPKYFLNHCEVSHLFPTHFGELDEFETYIKEETKTTLHVPKFTNHKFKVSHV